ncbi:hypothetical protein C8Q80DRAFT_1184879 [Daedaleopsis nitida]|nr:hypothetical protein C8Q80DRAFT_1184879 [Daedaleopsis nitida]
MIEPPHNVIVVPNNDVTAVPRRTQMYVVSGVTASVTPTEGLLLQLSPTMNTECGDRPLFVFFAAEAEGFNPLPKHLPRGLIELIARARQLQQSHIRGALTNGYKWWFIVVDIDADGGGASYRFSDPIRWTVGNWGAVNTPTPTIIAGILAAWIQSSFQEFKGDEWFVQ